MVYSSKYDCSSLTLGLKRAESSEQRAADAISLRTSSSEGLGLSAEISVFFSIGSGTLSGDESSVFDGERRHFLRDEPALYRLGGRAVWTAVADTYTQIACTARIDLPLAVGLESEDSVQLRRSVADVFHVLADASEDDVIPGARSPFFNRLLEAKRRNSHTFYCSLSRALTASSSRIQDAVRAAAIRALGSEIGLQSREAIPIILDELASESAECASAAAIAVGDYADAFLKPMIEARRSEVRWASARNDLDESLRGLSGAVPTFYP